MNTFSWEEIQEKPARKREIKTISPYCGSWTCAKHRGLVKKENIKNKPVWCPDCGSSLVWRYDTRKVISTWTK